MKTRRIIAGIGVIITLFFYGVGPVLAMPPLPSSFYGTVKLAGENIEVGTVISARINGVQYASTHSTMFEGDTVYSLIVPGDDLGSPEIEGGVPGDTIVFYVGDRIAGQTATWESGGNVEMNLTGVEQWNVFLPAVLNAVANP